MTTKHTKDEAPIVDPKPPEQEPVPVQVMPKDRPIVGRVEFETADALPNGAAIYNVPSALRDRVLLWRHQQHEQNHQQGDGTWVYRATHTSGYATEEHDPALTPIEDVSA